ncbi:DUF2232 domain-containing protein [Azospirillum sp.]|uniref:DUF2232 domain-containing protein n=1 Tax=Azospirillum sp. TaxID=34012 RepID=UPI002D6E9064|nr:DUF2232 domain-containing protein [Azospirillum sp.]HYD70382.1 DUF2232 domain-containing protein [Azospirillum sp.]
MPTALVAALAGGAVSALFYAAVLFGSVGALILAYLAPLPLLLAGLWLGPRATAIAGGTAAVLVLLASGSVTALVGYAISAAVPAAFVVRQALLARPTAGGGVEWYPPGLLLMGLTGFGIAAFFAAVVWTIGEPGGLEGVLRETLAGMVRAVAPEGGTAAQSGALGPEAFGIARLMPGLVVVSWLLMTIINGALAQGLLMRFSRNRRPPMRITAVELPGWLPLAFALAVAGAALLPDPVGFLALNVALVLAVPFSFAGLAVVHAFAGRQKARVALLVGFYLFLFLFGWPIVVLVGLGVIEQWIGLRRRWANAGPDQEDE